MVALLMSKTLLLLMMMPILKAHLRETGPTMLTWMQQKVCSVSETLLNPLNYPSSCLHQPCLSAPALALCHLVLGPCCRRRQC
jgi:hypothetical protein